MVRKQVNGHVNILEKSEPNQGKLTNHLVFQNVRNILQKLHILLIPDKEHKKFLL